MPQISISGIIPPIITPFRENGDVDYDAFTRNIERWNTAELSGYLVLGSNSEAVYLNQDEKLRLIGLTIASTAKNRTVLAGTGLESTRETIHLTNRAAKLGAHAALIITPSFYGNQMTEASLIRHYTTIADAVEIPILIYNVPKFTRLNIPVEAIRTLSRHPNIIGMKDSAGNFSQLVAIKNSVEEKFGLIAGSASIFYPALGLGIKTGILALANCAPTECAGIKNMFDRGHHEEAKMLQERMLPVNTAITETYGIAGLKYACTLLGYEGGFPRSPLLPLTSDQQKALRKILETAELMKP